MHILTSVLKAVIISQLSFAGPAAVVKRSPAQQAEGQKLILHASMDYIVAQMAIVNSAKDFEKHFLMGLAKADRDAIRTELSKIGKFPSFKRVGDNLVATNGKQTVTLTRTAVGKHDYLVNNVKWHYEPGLAFMPQFDKLQRQLNKGSHAQMVFDLLIPRAEAVLPILAAIAMVVITAAVTTMAQDVINEGICWAAGQANSTLPKCVQLKEAKEKELYGDAPAMDAITNQVGTDNMNILGMFEANGKICPSNTDGQPRQYRAQVRRTETKDGKTTPVSDWFEVVQKLTPSGIPTEMIVSVAGTDPEKVDPSSPEGAKELIMRIEYTAENKKPLRYIVPNPDYDPKKDLFGKPTLTLQVNQQLTAEQKDMIEKAQDLVAYVNARSYRCTVADAISDQAAGIEILSPEQVPADQ